jgi:hypothetical protein
MRVAGRNGPKSDPSFQGRRFYKRRLTMAVKKKAAKKAAKKKKK